MSPRTSGPEGPTTANAGRDASGVRRAGWLSRRTAVLLALVIAALVAVADQVTKAWAVASLTPDAPRAVLGEILQFRLIRNSGAAWGMGAGITPVVTVVQLLICLGAIVMVVRSVRSTGWVLALGLIVGGALGNIHDRILRAPGPFRGEVVDFLELPHWPIFNVADIAVSTGAVLIVLLGVLGRPAGPTDGDDGPRSADSADSADRSDRSDPADDTAPTGPGARA